MELLARVLARVVGRPVLDRTDMTETYAFELEWTPGPNLNPAKGSLERMRGQAVGADPPDLSDPTIFTTILECLGLRLESTKGPVETIAIEQVDRLTAN
jgi:uncharacterized protein (TIGR03435 family)